MLKQALSHILTWWAHSDTLEEESDTGQGLVEYALLLIFVAVVVVVILAVLAPGLNNAYSNIVQTL